MSQAPSGSANSEQEDRYAEAWKTLLNWTEEGRSFSGHERNCCFLNVPGSERFAEIAAVSGINFPDDSRGIGICDWDFDGRQDIWLSARTAPQVRFMRNESPSAAGNRFLKLKLVGSSCNRDAIGARVTLLHAKKDQPIQTKSLRAGEGFLSQGSKWLHFGLGLNDSVDSVEIHWPDGTKEVVRTPDGSFASSRHYTITQGAGLAKPWEPPTVHWEIPKQFVLELPEPSGEIRHRVASRLPLGELKYLDQAGNSQVISGRQARPLAILLWASWCRPCLDEIRELSQEAAQLQDAGIDIVALSVDGIGGKPTTDFAAALSTAQRLEFPFSIGQATDKLLDQLQTIHDDLFMVRRPLPLPSSFLLDTNGHLAAIYRGRIDPSHLLKDVADLQLSPEAWFLSSLPRSGRWISPPTVNPAEIYADKGRRLAQAGDWEIAENAFRQALEFDQVTALPYYFLGLVEVRKQRFTIAEAHFRRTLELQPDFPLARLQLGDLQMRKQKFAAAKELYLQVIESQPLAEAHMKLGILALMADDNDAAEAQFRKAVQLEPRNVQFRANLGKFLLDAGRFEEAAVHLRVAALGDQPNFAAKLNLAWLLSTAPDASQRDGELAIELAEACAAESSRKDPVILDRLAAAYASVGRFDDAVRLATEAWQLAGQMPQAAELKSRLELYRAGKPFHLERPEPGS